jgi:OOP family OmpA-OmpF porin
MKKLMLSFVSIMLFASSFSQTADYRKPSTLGVSFFLSDFQTAADLKKSGLSSVIKSKNLFRTGRMNPGLALTYLKGLSNHVDFSGSLGGSFLSYPVPNQPASSSNNFLLEGTANFNIKLLSDQFCFVPFADLGLGASKYLGNYSAFLPIGLGVQINLFDEAFIVLNSQYRTPVTENAASHLYHSITLAGVLGKKKRSNP